MINFVLTLLVFMSWLMYSILSYHVIIMLVLPVVVSCLYCKLENVIYTTVLSIPVMAVSHLIAFMLKIVPVGEWNNFRYKYDKNRGNEKENNCR